MKHKPSIARTIHTWGWAFCLVALFTIQTCQAQSAPTVPETNAGKRFSELVDVVNNGDEAARTAYFETAFLNQQPEAVAERVRHARNVDTQLGKLAVRKIVNSTENSVAVHCSCSAGPDVLMTITTSDEGEHLIDTIQLEGNYSGEDADTASPLTAEQREETIEELAHELRTKYVFDDVGEKMATVVENSLAKGEYKELSGRRQFCEHLTTQLRDICHDKHLGIRVQLPRNSQGRRQRRQPVNHGFEKVEYLEGGIGYLKFDFFSGDSAAEETASAAMNFLADSKAIIIDLRENGGGSPDMIAFLTSYLLDEKTHLNSFYNRPTDETTESWTRDSVPGLRPKSGVPIYVLTSNYTFSGAEEFSYNLKNLKRATIVGEVTGGGAHPVMGVSLGNGIDMRMPFARAINPITGTNWEGVGVKPHVETSASSALDEALKLAKAALQDPGN